MQPYDDPNLFFKSGLSIKSLRLCCPRNLLTLFFGNVQDLYKTAICLHTHWVTSAKDSLLFSPLFPTFIALFLLLLWCNELNIQFTIFTTLRCRFNFIQSVVRLPSSIALLTSKGIYLLNSMFPSPPPTQALDTTARVSGPMAVAKFLLSEA